MGVVRSRNGDELVAFDSGMSLTEAESVYPVPLSFAVAIVRYAGDTLFVYNSWLQEWQLPASWIEPGETPDDAARREVFEETGQDAVNLQHAGMVLLHLQEAQRYELGAVYAGEIETLRPFADNDEAEAMMLWNLQESVEGYVNEIAQKLASLTQAS